MPTTPAKPKPKPKATAADYGFVTAFLAAHPDVKKMVDQAIKNGWTQQRLEAAIKTTTWWKTRTDAQRQYDVLIKENPREVARRTNLAKQAITQKAKSMGVTLTDAQVTSLASYSVMNQASDGEMQTKVASFLQIAADGQAQGGTAGATIDQLRQGAQAYGITLSDDTLLKYTRQIEGGAGNVQGFQDAMREQAKVLYPSIAKSLDNGLTVKDIADPYLQMASKELGMNSADFDLTDTKWTRALTGQSGGTMTADEWMTTLRTDSRYGWDKSATARQQAVDLGSSLRQMFQGA